MYEMFQVARIAWIKKLVFEASYGYDVYAVFALKCVFANSGKNHHERWL